MSIKRNLTIEISDCQGAGWSAEWHDQQCRIYHEFGTISFGVATDTEGNVLSNASVPGGGLVSFNFAEMPEYPVSVTLICDSTNSDMGYYSGTESDVMLFCKSLDISEDRLATINNQSVNKYQEIVDRAIDGYLIPYYFVPLTKYSMVNADGTISKVFPGKIRMIALQWTAGLMLQSEFQNMEPNVQEAGTRFVEDAKKEMQQMVDFSTIIPGQRRKNPSPTMPPNLAPSKSSEILI